MPIISHRRSSCKSSRPACSFQHPLVALQLPTTECLLTPPAPIAPSPRLPLPPFAPPCLPQQDELEDLSDQSVTTPLPFPLLTHRLDSPRSLPAARYTLHPPTLSSAPCPYPLAPPPPKTTGGARRPVRPLHAAPVRPHRPRALPRLLTRLPAAVQCLFRFHSAGLESRVKAGAGGLQGPPVSRLECGGGPPRGLLCERGCRSFGAGVGDGDQFAAAEGAGRWVVRLVALVRA